MDESAVHERRIQSILVIFLVITAVGVFLLYRWYNNITTTPVVSQYETEATAFLEAYTENDIAAAITYAQSLQQTNPDDILGFLTLASAYIQKGIIESEEILYANLAYDEIQKALAINPESADAHRMLAQVYELRMEMDEALDAYNRAIIFDPEDYLAIGLRGHLYYLIGDLEKAEVDYKRSLEIEPENSRALTDLATLYLITDAPVDVEELLLRAIELETHHADLSRAYNALGVYYMDQGWYTDAIETFQSAVTYDPSMTPALNGIAMSNFYLIERDGIENFNSFEKRLTAAFDAVDATLSQDENFSRAYITLGFLFNILSDYESEEQAYRDGLTVVMSDHTLTAAGQEEVQRTLTQLLESF